jgi:WD40 repeat protein
MKRRLGYALFAILALLGLVAFLIGGEPAQPALEKAGPRLTPRFAGIVTSSPAPMRDVAFSPDGRILATTGVDGKVRLLAMPAGRLLRDFDHPGGATALVFSPDGQLVATAGYDGMVRLWRISDGASRVFRVSGEPLWTLAWSPDGILLAAAGEDKHVHLWPATGTGPTRILAGHLRNIWHIAFSPDGRTLASGGFDRDLRLWEVASGRPIRTMHGHDQGIVGVAIRATDGMIATGADDATIRLWRGDGTPLRTLAAGQYVDAVTFSADGKWLASGGRESHGINAVVKQIFGHRLASGYGVSSRLWRVSDGAMIAAFNRQSDDVVAVAISPDARWLAAGSDDGSVALWALQPEG